MTRPSPSDQAHSLLEWYDRHHRRLPWRLNPGAIAQGERPDPYRVWLSEIMLQQTTVGAVKSYFDAFTARWPTVLDLAAADVDDVMKAWAGLGYYSRARNLKKCADLVAEEFSGRFPDTEEGLRNLPGIGDYTSAAIAAIAFNRPSAVVDGNVERVVTRLHAIETPLPAAKPEIKALVKAMVPTDRPGDFAQAMMDLGATICTPRTPACSLCPLNDGCSAYKSKTQERYPLKLAKAEKPVRIGAAFVVERPDGAILLRKRALKGLLAGMAEVPTTDWTARQDGADGIDGAPFEANWSPRGVIVHVFTHFELRLSVYHAKLDMPPPESWWWADQNLLGEEALPTVMWKAVAAAIASLGKRSGKKKT